MHYSPLRYPGGKNKLAAFIANLCLENNIKGHYVEPYSGGASVALFLLLEGYVDYITINDKDRSLYAFWYAVLNHTDEFCDMISETPITMEVWHKQKQAQINKESVTLLELGFSTFFLNRTNRSGIISAGVIGGVEQNGNYLMDCRFNKVDLIKRIQLIGSKRKSIRLLQEDAIDLINLVEEETKTRRNRNTLFYFDPPYYDKGSTLYMNHYLHRDHLAVSERVKAIRNIHWVVSYDNTEEIRALYEGCRRNEFTFSHTAYESRIGKEVMFFSNSLILPEITDWNPLYFKKTNSNQILKYTLPK
ncbi:DNA adenine methylase [Myroides odoratimimus]|uniref:DNA adenine methylase n=1 Tax=Myroides odoratimimus TaxID=76832 RepID=UPI0025780CAB|nr:DNA adenine methylase [Myroides odoratimimus]MDM1517859.1 DNA adenine methylase [Myroides odoratimimus]